mgnify:CR=1 FL=1
MGFGGISIWQLLIVLVIVVLLFGTKKLRNIGGDLGGALKSFRSAMKDDNKGEEEDKDGAQQQLRHEDEQPATEGAGTKEKDKV